MTEEEAKKKWCPMVRFHVVPESSQTVYSNRDGDNLSSRCIASDCMMWQCYVGGKEGWCGLGGNP